jgi:hypothetical protein
LVYDLSVLAMVNAMEANLTLVEYSECKMNLLMGYR